MDGLDGAVAGLQSSPGVPTGRAARLWRVVVDLSIAVDEADARHAAVVAASGGVVPAASAAGGPADSRRGKGLASGQLEKLVVEFDDAYTSFVEGMQVLPSEAQLVALQAVDRQLAAMVRAQEAELWTERAVREDRRWREAQRLARVVIEAFDWPSRRLALVADETLPAGAVSERSSRRGQSPWKPS